MKTIRFAAKKIALFFGFVLALCCNGAMASDSESYPWKGILQDEATSGVVTLSDLKLNGHSRVAIVKPKEHVQAEVVCSFNHKECSKFALYRIVIGIHGEGPLASIFNSFCVLSGQTIEKFFFTAASKDGVYQMRFRIAETLFKKDAFKAWIDQKGQEPGAGTTIGILIVK